MKHLFFETPTALREWFIKNHLTETEFLLAYYKKHTKKPSISWSQSVDQALCFGWIDGIRRKVDDEVYTIRFTPRKTKSHWSAVNIAKVAQLKKENLMYPAGLEAFAKLDPSNSELFSYENKKPVVLSPTYEKEIQTNEKAWQFFSSLAPSYKKGTINWVMQAKREETRLRRLAVLIESAEQGLKVPHLRKRT